MLFSLDNDESRPSNVADPSCCGARLGPVVCLLGVEDVRNRAWVGCVESWSGEESPVPPGGAVGGGGGAEAISRGLGWAEGEPEVAEQPVRGRRTGQVVKQGRLEVDGSLEGGEGRRKQGRSVELNDGL